MKVSIRDIKSELNKKLDEANLVINKANDNINKIKLEIVAFNEIKAEASLRISKELPIEELDEIIANYSDTTESKLIYYINEYRHKVESQNSKALIEIPNLYTIANEHHKNINLIDDELVDVNKQVDDITKLKFDLSITRIKVDHANDLLQSTKHDSFDLSKLKDKAKNSLLSNETGFKAIISGVRYGNNYRELRAIAINMVNITGQSLSESLETLRDIKSDLALLESIQSREEASNSTYSEQVDDLKKHSRDLISNKASLNESLTDIHRQINTFKLHEKNFDEMPSSAADHLINKKVLVVSETVYNLPLNKLGAEFSEVIGINTVLNNLDISLNNNLNIKKQVESFKHKIGDALTKVNRVSNQSRTVEFDLDALRRSDFSALNGSLDNVRSVIDRSLEYRNDSSYDLFNSQNWLMFCIIESSLSDSFFNDIIEIPEMKSIVDSFDHISSMPNDTFSSSSYDSSPSYDNSSSYDSSSSSSWD